VIEPRIVRVKDLAERTLSDLANEQQVAPPGAVHRERRECASPAGWLAPRTARRRPHIDARRGGDCDDVVFGERDVVDIGSVGFSDLGDQAELSQPLPRFVVGRRALERVPIDRTAIGDLFEQLVEIVGF
jgi:hypothetical protein